MRVLKLAWRLLRRDIAAGEVQVLIAAIVLAVTAVTAVGFLTDRAERALALEANRLLGGDAVLRADEPIDDALLALADAPGLRSSQTRSFRSMVRAGESFGLAEVRALGEGYPLRGRYRVADADGGERTAADIPAPGEAWMSRAGAQTLGVSIGDTLALGDSRLRLSALVLQEPDSALDYFNVAPRVFIRLDALEATGLVQEGSRIGHRLVVAGEPAAVEAFTAAAGARLARGQSIETIADARPEIRSALERADRFLGLAALIAVVLSAIAVAMAARRHSARHLDGCAVMRCLGASQATLAGVHLGELALIGIVASLGGVLLALGIQVLLGGWLAQALGLAIPPPGIAPALEGLAVGLTVLLAFGAPPVLALRRVPALRVLRREIGSAEPGAIAAAVLGLGSLAALLWWKAGSATLGLTVLGAIVATLLALALLARLLIVVLRAVRARLRGPWRYGLANIGRRAGASTAQIAALGLGLMAILLLTLVRTDLIASWQRSLPDDAPNRFLVGVQPDQADAVEATLAELGVDAPQLYPMVRGRLVAVNGEPVRPQDYAADGERAQRLAEREFNLSWQADLERDDNEFVAGEYWPPQARGGDEISVDRGIAQTLGWSLGDRLEFDVAGQTFEARITSLRDIEWESFRPNFFVVAMPGALDGYPASFITAVHVPAASTGFTRTLVERFPNVSVIDVDAVLAQVRATADQVATAVEYVFGFTLLAGVLVLLASISASQDERLLEGGVMRVLGASRRQLRWAHVAEFAALGTLAGLTAAIAAGLTSAAIASQVFDLPWAPDWRLAFVGAGLGLAVVTLTGLAATRRLVTAPPGPTLRALDA